MLPALNAQSSSERTLLVVGVAGSGTSMVATVLDLLGVPDERMWSATLPDAFDDLDPMDMGFRNPHVLVAFRDPVAIAERSHRSGQDDFVGALKAVATRARQLVRWTALLRCPVLMVSYEKAMRSPERFVDAVISFAGLSPTQQQRREAIASIRQIEERQP